MKRSGKNLGDACHAVAVVATPGHAHPSQHRRKMGVGLSMRRELLRQFVPQYQEASSAHKRMVLTDFIRLTGYHRKYAISLLNKIQDEQQTVKRPSRCMYGSDVEEALVQVWEQTNGLCSKRLIPFLPTVLEAMERHGHLHLTPECRGQLLALSVATADRLLRPHRQRVMRGLCTTRAGTLLKQNIPIRTFEQWDEQTPGFVEADLVAHCDASVEGSYLFTLTLTDIATGWTECLPLLTKSAEAVLQAIKQARSLFPFPLLGLDTDNGTEFMNDVLMEYCEQEHITFTRGRPLVKNDQCYVEQKNGHIVRHVVGYARFVGEPTFQCLGELYRVLSWYVNSFQSSMKLCLKLKEGRKVQRIYDEAKTPLQRLLQAQVLIAEQERELRQQFEERDPVHLLEQVKQAQLVLFRYSTGGVPQQDRWQQIATERFRVAGSSLVPRAADTLSESVCNGKRSQEEGTPASFLTWHRTSKDPFVGEWERIAGWVCAEPMQSCRAMFEELCRLSPERYQPSHMRTLQRGVQKIRARLALLDVPSQDGLSEAEGVVRVEHDEQEDRLVAAREQEAREQETQDAMQLSLWCGVEAGSDEVCFPQEPEELRALNPPVELERMPDKKSDGVQVHSDAAEMRTPQATTSKCVTIAEGIEQYLQSQRRARRRPKTLEWHETALRLLEQYVRTEWEGVLLAELTESHMQGWIQWLGEPTAMGIQRIDSSILSYVRSARAWCSWLVKAGSLTRTPFAKMSLAKVEPPTMQPLEEGQWRRLLNACQLPGESRILPEWAPARNQALLWVLYDTGMKVSEVCALRLRDIDVEGGTLLVRSQQFMSRHLVLGKEALQVVRMYIERYRHGGSRVEVQHVEGSDVPLFLSETGKALTKNGVMLLFRRLRRRAGLTRERIGPTQIRDSFALRYLQAGGDAFTLRDLLGYQESAVVKRYLNTRSKR